MLDPRFVTENVDTVRGALEARADFDPADLQAMLELMKSRKQSIGELERLRQKLKEANGSMASLDKASEAFQEARRELRSFSEESKQLDTTLKEIESQLREHALKLPNLPADGVPDGRSSEDNAVLRSWGSKPQLPPKPKDHVALATQLGILDLERASKLSGARFSVLIGYGARLQRALSALMLDLHTQNHGYTEVVAPSIVRASALLGTGQLPKFKADLFKLELGEAVSDKETLDRYLIPTGEVPLTNLHAGEIIGADALPTRYVASTPCYRSEAGSYGRDTKGLIRQHEFEKVELVALVAPEDGLQALEELTGHAEAILQALNLHYRVVELCVGDLGFSSRKTMDIEVWCPGQGAYREVSSCSWFGDFQARRANIRYRPSQHEKPLFVHTLNGSGLPIGRTMVALLEQHQEEDGSVRLPEALWPYMGGVTSLTP